MLHIKKVILVCLFFLIQARQCIIAQSHHLSGLIKYQFTYYGSGDTLQSGFRQEYELYYKDNEVSYFFLKGLESLNDTSIPIPLSTGKKYIHQYQNLNDKVLVSQQRALNVSVIVKDSMVPIIWKLSNKTKKIQNIECFSAQAEYRGRVWTAWYAPSIPISSGPWKLYGLPGMILEAEDIKRCTRFNCLLVNVPFNGNIVIETPEYRDKNKQTKSVNSIEFASMYKNNIALAEKMSIKKNQYGEDKTHFGVADIEVFDFEKNLTMKRFQQKLSDIPKK